MESLLSHKSKNLMKLHNWVLYFKNLLHKEKSMYEKIKKLKKDEIKTDQWESYLFDD